jgi:hypothetical protein
VGIPISRQLSQEVGRLRRNLVLWKREHSPLGA